VMTVNTNQRVIIMAKPIKWDTIHTKYSKTYTDRYDDIDWSKKESPECKAMGEELHECMCRYCRDKR